MSNRNFTWFFLLSLFGVAAFGAGIFNPLVFDDLSFIAHNEWLRPGFIKGFFTSFLPISNYGFSGYRPLVMTSFVLDRSLGGAPWMRAHNLALHIVNAALVFELIRTYGRRHRRGAFEPWSFFAACVFLLHPLQTNVINLVWKRSDIYVLFGMLVGCLAFGRWSERRSGAWGFWVIGLGGYAFALLSKESAVVFPALLACTQSWVHAPIRPLRQRFVWVGLPLVALTTLHLTVVLILQPLALDGIEFASYMPSSLHLDRWDYAKTQGAALWTYVRLLLLPNNLQILHWVDPVRTLSNPRFLSGMALLLGSVAIAAWQRKARPWIAFSVFWFFFALAPTSSVFPLQMIVDEDRMYVPMVAFALALSTVFFGLERWFAHSRRIFRGLAVLLLAVYAALDVHRARTWGNSLELWAQNAMAYPMDPRPWVNLGNVYAQRGRFDRAQASFTRALKIDPAYAAAHYFFAEFSLTQGNLQAARAHFEQSKSLGYLASDATMNLAAITHREGDLDAAERIFEESLRLNPANTLALRNYAEFLFEGRKNYPRAMAILQRAYQIAPWESATRLKIASITMRQGGHDEEVRAILDEILRDDPDQTEARALRDQLAN